MKGPHTIALGVENVSLAQQWLKANAYGYSDLTLPEVAAINEFCLLWSFFEEWVLENNASVSAIKAKAAEAATISILELQPFNGALEYFKARYFADGKSTHYFDGLRFQGKNSGRIDVENVLCGTEAENAEALAALLIIVYRLRNNLLHGEKWSYRVKDQLGNFTNANIVLMGAMDLFRSRGLCNPEGTKK